MLSKLVAKSNYGLAKYRIPIMTKTIVEQKVTYHLTYHLTYGEISYHGVVLFKDGKPIECYGLRKEDKDTVKVYKTNPEKIEEYFKLNKLEP